jgi:hypothetical protein
MAHTRRKRRSKHRGTAAGNIEARGRTGRRVEGGGSKAAARPAGGRGTRTRVPSWKSAYLRAFLAALFLFGLTRLGLGGDMPLEQSVLFAVVAMFVYVPLGYYMDTFIYSRRQKREAQQRSGR